MKKYRFHLLDLTEHGRLNLSTIERARPKTHTLFFAIEYITMRAMKKKLVKQCTCGELIDVFGRYTSELYVDFARLSNHFIFQIH